MSLSVANIEYPITNIPPIHFICDYEYFTEANLCIKSVSILCTALRTARIIGLKS